MVDEEKMEEARASLNYARISPRKVKIVLDLIRYQRVDKAIGILNSTPKAASELLIKLLKSAIANAEENHNLDKSLLYISETYANQGPTLKRMRPRAHGRGFRINKRTSHITIVLREIEN